MNRITNPAVTRPAQRCGVKFLPTTLIAALALLAVSAWATIPPAALADPRYGLGYLVVTYYAGVTNDGTGDCSAGINQAIKDAGAAAQAFYSQAWFNKTNVAITTRPLAVFFPSGIYQISNVVECYQWNPTSGGSGSGGPHVLVGSTAGGSRPRIKLAAGAPNYQSASAPRQMISFRAFVNASGLAESIPNPMATPADCQDSSASNFYDDLRNLDFDCNGNPGAIGVVFLGAQWCTIANVRVWATNAYAGFYTLPGRGACSANLEVDGGQYGVVHGVYPGLNLAIPSNIPNQGSVDGCAGPTIVGLTLANQTAAALLIHDWFGAPTVVGFNISNCPSIAVQNTNGGAGSVEGSLTLLDGQIQIGGGNNSVAIDDTVGANLYARNVYVSGTTNLVKSAGTTTTGAGTWSQIAEYSYNETYKVSGVPPNTGYNTNSKSFESYSLINGTLQNWTVPFPITPNIVKNCGTPPTNLVSRHLWASFPSYNGGDPTNDPPTVVVSTNSGCWQNTNDSTAVLQAAIDLASTNSSPNYNGRVFVPGGLYYLTNTVTLRSNTMFIGLGRNMTFIMAGMAWQPTNWVTLLTTEDNANATTALGHVSLAPRNVIVDSDTNYMWFTDLTWRAGGRSVVFGIDPQSPWAAADYTHPRAIVLFTNNGGGHYYMTCLGSDDDNGHASENNPLFRKMKIAGTTQPLWFYAYNIEHGHYDTEEVEVNGASNVRFLTLKKEGQVPEMVMTNCTNVAAFGLGNAVYYISGYIQVAGASTNILCANLSAPYVKDNPDNNCFMLTEAITGQPATNVLWPNMVSLYKRGEINDALMFVTNNSTPTAGLVLTATPDAAYPSLQIDLSWNSVAGATGYQLQRSTTNGGPYAVVANTPSVVTNYNDTGVFPGTTYYYVVAATNSSGPLTNSAQATATTQPNAAPTLNPISGLTLNTNAPQQTVNLSGISAGANESPIQAVTNVTARSSNPGLIPTPTVNYTNPSATGTLTFTPAANASGTATITVMVTDNGGTNGGGVDTAMQAFTVTVTSGVVPAGNIYSNLPAWSDADINSNLWTTAGGAGAVPAFGSGGIENDYVVPGTNALFSNTGTITNYLRVYATNTAWPYTMYFQGDSLSLGSNWLLKLKSFFSSSQGTNYSAFTFTNSVNPAHPGLILNGGMIEDGEPNNLTLTNWLYGVIGAASGTLSYLSLSISEFHEPGQTAHNLYIAGTVVGGGNIMICGGTNGAVGNNTVICANANPASTFSGTWIVEGGILSTAPNAVAGAYGSNCSFVVDNLYPIPTTNWGNTSILPSARLDLLIPVTSTGTLIVTNSGQLKFTSTCTFSAITIAGANVAVGSYTAQQLTNTYPGAAPNIVAGSTGTLIVGASHPVFGGSVMSGTNLVLTGSGGSPNGAYRVLTSTNPALPLAGWTPVMTNSFSGTGSFSNALPISPSDARRYYRLVTP